jgi:hypothetical protein
MPPRPCCAIDLLAAELEELSELVTAHLGAIPSSWGVESSGVTGPEGGGPAVPPRCRSQTG